MKRLLSILVLSSLLIACSDPVARVRYKPLAADQLYEYEQVYDYVFALKELADPQVQAEAKKYFLQAVDLYRNQTNPEEAIHYFKKALSIYPDAKCYFELGNALYDREMYMEAQRAYTLATKLRVNAPGSAWYQLARACAMEQDAYQAAAALRKAIEEGGASRQSIERDKVFASMIASVPFQELFVQTLASAAEKPSSRFAIFTRSFPQKTLPYRIDEGVWEKMDMDKAISYEFEDLVTEMQTASRFSREVSQEFIYVAKVAENERYVALIYASVDVMSDVMPANKFYLVTYTPKGEQISKILFAGQHDAEKILAGNFDHAQEITVTEYLRQWDKPFTEVPFSENKITGQIVQKVYQYHLSAEGQIIEGKANTASTATRLNRF